MHPVLIDSTNHFNASIMQVKEYIVVINDVVRLVIVAVYGHQNRVKLFD
jgi:hypothetical protein